jgi:hypothetical protein
MVKQLGVELWSADDAKIHAAASAVYKTWFATARNPRQHFFSFLALAHPL